MQNNASTSWPSCSAVTIDKCLLHWKTPANSYNKTLELQQRDNGYRIDLYIKKTPIALGRGNGAEHTMRTP